VVRTFACLLAALWLPLVGLDAHARTALGPGSRVVVLESETIGDLDETRRKELSDALRTGLSRGEFELVDAPPSLACAPTGGAQWDPACAASAARTVSADFAVVMTIAVDRRDYEIGIEVISAESSEITASSSERCEVCGIAEASELIDTQAAALRARLEALTLAPPVLSFRSTPPGAVIRIDGEVAGQAPFERTVEPGTHDVQATLDGYIAETQRIDAVTGLRSTMAFDLQPIPRSVRFRKLRVFGWTALGVGAAGTVAGATLIGIAGRPNRLDCSGDNVDPDGDCKFLYATLPAGIGTLVTGVALLATGVGILVGTRDKASSDRRARLTPTFAGSQRGARLGIVGRF
jgi:hypothetical protein